MVSKSIKFNSVRNIKILTRIMREINFKVMLSMLILRVEKSELC